MKFYKLNNAGLNREKIEFKRTSYGKMVSVLAYTFTYLCALCTIVNAILSIRCKCLAVWFVFFAIIDLTLTLFAYIVGSIYFYKELKEYVKEKNKLLSNLI